MIKEWIGKDYFKPVRAEDGDMALLRVCRAGASSLEGCVANESRSHP